MVFSRAAQNITGAESPCDDKDEVDVAYNFAGETTTESDFEVTATGGKCHPESGWSGQDSISTVDFKPLGSGALAQTCHNFSGSAIVEADVRLNDNSPWTFYPSGSACESAKAYDIESVLTHEFGHVYGLADLNIDDTSTTQGSFYQTMNSGLPKCTKFQRTLAAGELTALRYLY
ncbi:matrixin family metalloprotease [Nocardioides sp. T2.26MG-1]|uniref:matrixin family metalloprotease n=1 Tax=Nocardioides sp. T2.26MG-1 TaxID=3041166 RepID=UPI00247783CD|nr:matrixin family metalloprotease [Nocardioides sp. T2.26MG-1]CAI9419353.1 hypothetical protein HIDPHFAB_03650 [Nocardioides sp. T2.26MG-1]